jgi:TonB family protein
VILRAAAALCAVPLAALAVEPAPPAAATPAQSEAPPAPPRQLQVYQKVMPRFDARGLGAEGGCVTVKFQIRHDGFVGEVEVLESKPATLAEPAIAAMKQWQFQSFPATDKPVWATQTFHFTPEPMRMPDDAIRAPFAALGEGGALNSAGCGALRPKLPAVTEAPKQ